MTLISIPNGSLSWLAFLMFLFSCRAQQDGEVVPVPDRADIEKEKEKLLYQFYHQEDESLLQLKEYMFRDVDLLKAVLPHEGRYSLWSKDSLVLPVADALLKQLEDARFYGLQPGWYHHPALLRQRHLLDDSAHRHDPASWSKFEVMMSNAFAAFIQDLHYGRLEADSIDQRRQRRIDPVQFSGILDSLRKSDDITGIISQLEPRHQGYQEIKKMMASFLPRANGRRFTVLVYPWQDSLVFLDQLHRRLSEEGFTEPEVNAFDSLGMAASIKKAQVQYGLKKDGKAGKLLVAALNNWDMANYARMAINLDRYRMMPDSLPESYVLVNIPSYHLQAHYQDTLVFRSKVIVGKPRTRSPLLNASFSNIVVYPQWNVPESIIFGEIIPKMKKDPGYLRAQNMILLDRRDSMVDPQMVDWHKANKNNFRYRVRQGEGLDNSLGIIKFNFLNKYDVYLHDTNARSLFGLDERSLSHGCIRVEKWHQMADFLSDPSTEITSDSTISSLLKTGKKAVKSLKWKTELFIRYFTLYDAGEGLKMYPDIYGEDNLLIDSYLF